MQRDSDEDAWRAIVENYGERIELDDESSAEPARPAEPDEKQGYDAAGGAGLQRLFRPLPEPRPSPRTSRTSWTTSCRPRRRRCPSCRRTGCSRGSGLFGSPTILLVCLVLGVRLLPWLAYLLVASFIGGFAYLVVKMPRDTDIDPWDDGARL